MHQTIPIGAAATLAYGSVLINTMPIWLGALTDKADANEALPGLLASILLLAAAIGCGSAEPRRGPSLFRICSIGVVGGLPIIGAMAEAITSASLLIAGGIFGISLGLLLYRALMALIATADPARLIGNTLAIGVIASLVVLLAVSVYPDAILAILSVLSLIPAAAALIRAASAPTDRFDLEVMRPGWSSLGFFPFFIAMGAYWVFLEIYASIQGLATISEWLFAGLLASAIGSTLAARLRSTVRKHVLLLSMLAAAITGAATYLTSIHWMIGATILANGFFLFLFFSLYLGAVTTAEAGRRMAVYLAGFALGGAVGSITITMGGYVAMASFIFLSGCIAVPAAMSSRPGPLA